MLKKKDFEKIVISYFIKKKRAIFNISSPLLLLFLPLLISVYRDWKNSIRRNRSRPTGVPVIEKELMVVRATRRYTQRERERERTQRGAP